MYDFVLVLATDKEFHPAVAILIIYVVHSTVVPLSCSINIIMPPSFDYQRWM